MYIKKIITVLVLTFVLLLSACVSSNNHPNNKIPNDDKVDDIEFNKSRVNRKSGSTLLGIAAFREFENNSNKQTKRVVHKLSNDDTLTLDNDEALEEEEYLKISYPFDYVKIHKATKFDLYISEDNEGLEFEALKYYTGLGELEVTVADFTTYIDDPDYNKIIADVTDTLISFRGKNGLYTILLNSYARGNENNYENGHRYWLFSSHKTITATEIGKNFEPPIYSILLEITDEDEYKLSFKKDRDLTSLWTYFSEEKIKYNIDTNSIEYVARDTMYTILELSSLEELEVVVEIESIDVELKKIKVKSDGVLSEVILDGFTQYNNETIELAELLGMLLVGDIIRVSYDNYYEDYEPTVIYANSLVKIQTEES